jgi:hypothetical protein
LWEEVPDGKEDEVSHDEPSQPKGEKIDVPVPGVRRRFLEAAQK